MIPRELIENLNFPNFVKVLFFAKNNMETVRLEEDPIVPHSWQIKEKALRLKSQNRKPRKKREGKALAETTEDKIKEVIRREQVRLLSVLCNSCDPFQADFDALVEQVRRSGRKYEDPTFGPNTSPSSLFPHEPNRDTFVAKWERPEVIAPHPALFCDGVDQGDVIQGRPSLIDF